MEPSSGTGRTGGTGRRTRALLGAVLLLAACGDEKAPAAGGLAILNPPSPIVSPGHDGLVNERPYFHDFGRVRFGAVVEHVFRLENRDPVPVTVRDLLASCSCTVPRVSYTSASGEVVAGAVGGDGPVIVLPPGAVAEVLIRIDTGRMRSINADLLENVRLRSDSATTPFLTFELHLYVERTFRSAPPRIELGRVPSSAGARGTAVLTRALASTRATIAGVQSVDGPLAASVTEEQQLGVPVWKLLVEVEPGLPRGALQGTVHLATTDAQGAPPGEAFAVEVIGRIVDDVVLDPESLHLVLARSGEASEARATLRALIPGQRVRLLGARIEGAEAAHLAVEFAPVEPDAAGRSATWDVVLRASAELAAETFGGRVILETDDGAVPEVAARYSGTSGGTSR